MISLRIRTLVAVAAYMLTAVSVIAQPAPALLNVKFYGAGTVGVGGITTLDLTINNTGAVDLTAVTGSDILPATHVIATPNGLLSACTPGSTLGPLTAVAGSSTILIGTSTILAGGACTVQVNVVGVVPGALLNTFNSTDAKAGPGTPGTATLRVLAIAPPTVAKTFGAPTIPLGGMTSMMITVTAAQALAGVSFTDTLPAGLAVATPNGLATTCTGTVLATAGSGAVSLTGATFAAAGSCTVTVNVTGVAAGTQINAVQASDINAGFGNVATATLIVLAPVTLTKAFGAASININGVTALTFTLMNPNAGTAVTGIGFTDTLPAGLKVSTPNGLPNGTCAGAITAAGSNIIVSGVTLAGGATCTFFVNVVGVSAGTQVNTTSTVASTNAGTGAPATATIVVVPIIEGAGIYQLRYFANLDKGDSYVNLTNAGTLDGRAPAGNICANVYTFDPAEEMISCCACPITPNGLVSLSVRNDLISNTLTPGVPTSVTVKLLASSVFGTGAAAGVNISATACNAAAVNTGASGPPSTGDILTRGMRAWATTLHLNTSGSPAVGYQKTETPFSTAELSVSELAKLNSFCGFIQANGSGFGICKSCRFGALGSEQK